MSTTSLADAKNRLSEIVSSAEKTHERTVITKNGRPAAILLSVEDFASLEATLDILEDPEAIADIRSGEIEGKYDLYYTDGEMTQIFEAKRSGRPMTDDEIESLVEARMGSEAYHAARRAIYLELSRDPDANVRERARFYAADAPAESIT